MKIGLCTNMVAQGKDGIGSEAIYLLKEIGYDYLEFPLAQITDLSKDQFNVLKSKVLNTGLKCEAFNNFFPANMRLTGIDTDNEKINKYLDESIERASRLGAEVIVFGSAKAKNVPEGFPIDEAWDQIVSLLRRINDKVEKYGIIIAIEPLNKSESNIVTTFSEGLKLVKDADRKNINLLVDYYHFTMEKENPEDLLKADNFLKHVHFADPEGRIFPAENNKEDFVDFFSKLKKINYNSRISVEAYTNNLEQDAKKALNFLRNI